MKYLRKKQPSLLGAAVGTAIATSCLGPAVSLAQDGRQLEEIIVTTERRATTEATTAISMEVLSDDFLASNQIKDIVDLQNAVPAMQFFQNGSYVQANLRGVGNPSRGGPSEQVGVPVFFDGATQGEEMALASGFFDVSDVQVLRGPQATFVGQSAVGGAILINSERPNFDGLNGFVEATAGTYGQRKVMGAVNLTMTDNLAGRIAYMSENRESFYTNVAPNISTGGNSNEPGDQQDDNYRFSLLWEPTEKFSLWTKFEQTELHSYGIPEQPNPRPFVGFRDHDDNDFTPAIPVTSYSPNFQGPAPGTGTVGPNGEIIDGTPGAGGVIYDPLDPFEIHRAIPNARTQTNKRISAEVDYTFNSGITFRSLSNSIKMDRVQLEGGNSAVYSSPTGFHLGPGMHTWSQEFNLISPEGQRLEWLVGAYRNDRHTELHLNIGFSNPNGVFGAPCGWEYEGTWTPCPTSGDRTSALYWQSFDDVIHTAAYGQLNFDINDTLELTVELRHNDDDNTQLRFTYGAGFPPLFDGTVPTPAHPVACPSQIPNEPTLYCPEGVYTAPPTVLVWDDTQTTGKVGINWEPRDGHFLYAFFARGYKSGQSTIPGTEPIRAEVVDDIELGWKGTLADGRLYGELGIYQMDYADMQVSALRITAEDSRAGVTNAGDSDINGVEGSLRWLAPGGFGVDASFAYTDSELGDIVTVDTRALPFNPTFSAPGPGDIGQGCQGPLGTAIGQCFDFSPYTQTLSGREGPLSPKLTYNFSIDYAFQLGNGGTITPRLSFNHSDVAYTNILQSNLDHYYETDERDVLNFSLTYNRDAWDVQLFATNVTDEVYIEGADTSGNAVLYGDPRVVGVRARMDF